MLWRPTSPEEALKSSATAERCSELDKQKLVKLIRGLNEYQIREGWIVSLVLMDSPLGAIIAWMARGGWAAEVLTDRQGAPIQVLFRDAGTGPIEQE